MYRERAAPSTGGNMSKAAPAKPNKARRQVIVAAVILIVAVLCIFSPIFVSTYFP